MIFREISQETEEGRDRFAGAATNPVKSVASEPVSTFSIDVDTRLLRLRAPGAQCRAAAAEGCGARRGDDQLLPLRLSAARGPQRALPADGDGRCRRRGTRPTSSSISPSRAIDVARSERPRANLVLPDRHLGLDGAGGPAAAAQERLPHARRHAAAGRHGRHRHLCRRHAGGAGADQDGGEAQDPRGHRRVWARAARRPAAPASRRPIGWPKAPSTRRQSTASSSPPMATSMSASPIPTS